MALFYRTGLMMMALGCIWSLSAFAQEVEFEVTFGSQNGPEDGLTVLETNDNGYLLIGWTETATAGLADFRVIKTDSMGDEEWALTHGGFNNDIPSDGIELADGSFVIIGYTGSFTSSPSRDVYLLKLDKDGNEVWTKSIGGNQTDEGTSIKETPDGGFILTALTESFGAGNQDAWLIKTDGVGDTLWTKTFGGTEQDDVWDVELAPDGGYVFTGGTYSFSNGDGDDLWMVKTDANGVEEWMTIIGEEDMFDFGIDLVPVSDGYGVTGLYNADPQQQGYLTGDVMFAKVDLQGNVLWNKPRESNAHFEGTGIDATDDGGFALCGFRTELSGSIPLYFWVSRADADGETLWTKELGKDLTASRAQDVIQRADGHFAAVGFTDFSQTFPGDIYLVGILDTAGLTPVDTNDTSATGLTEMSVNQKLVVYPNPTNEQLTVKIGNLYEFGAKSIRVSSISGQFVQEKIISPTSTTIQVSLPKSGIYIIDVVDRSGVTLMRGDLVVVK